MDNPLEVERVAQEQGLPVSAIYEMDITAKTELIESMPNNANLFLKRGNDYYELKKYEEAIKDFKKVIDLNSQIPEAYHYLADCYINLNMNKEAIEFYTKASIFSDYKSIISVYQRRAIAKKNCNDLLGALSDIDHAIEINPNDYSEFYKLRSEIFFLLDDLDKAENDFEKYENMRIASLKAMLKNLQNKEKVNCLIDLFSSLNDEEQNDLLATLIFEYQDRIMEQRNVNI